MKKNGLTVLVVLALIIITLAILALYKWLFEAIYYSDMPEWMKYFLLK